MPILSQANNAVPLKITLKPNEKILISGALITNGNHLAQFTVGNEVPILREKDLLAEKDANTICKKIYYGIQLMYFEPGSLAAHHQTFWNQIRILSSAVPTMLPLIDEISEHILQERYYQALKSTRKLITYEQQLTDKANERTKNVR